MDLQEYVRILRRRWIIVIACVAVAAGAALATASEAPVSLEEGDAFERGFVARYFVAAQDGFRLEPLVLLAQSNEVVARAAERLEIDTEPGEQPPRLANVASDGRGLLIFRATDLDPDRAVEVATAYAVVAMDYVDERIDEQLTEEAESLMAAMVDQQDSIRQLGDRVATLSEGSLEARLAQTELDAAVAAYARLQEDLVQIRSDLVARPLYTFEPGVAAPETIPDDAGNLRLGAAADGPARLAYGLGLGLLIGLAVAFGAEHLDTRIHTRREAERVFGVPVVAEIPRLRRFRPPRSAGSDGFEPALSSAYGRLRVALLHMPRWIPTPSSSGPSTATHVDSPAALGLTDGTGIVIVTSAARGEGRTATVINLAASLAAAGRRVAVVDCDHQNPMLSTVIAEPKENSGTSGEEDALDDSSIPGVKLVPAPLSVRSGGGPAEATRVIQTTLERVDLVVVDTGPILSTIDAASLIPHADAVVLVARVGRVTEDEATEVRDLLANLHAPVTGVARVATRDRAHIGRPARTAPTVAQSDSSEAVPGELVPARAPDSPWALLRPPRKAERRE